MNRSLIADLVVSIHFGYVTFVVGGLFVIILGGIFRWRFIKNFWLRAIHLAMILLVVFETLFGISCPLTDWEYELRITAGQQNVASESFIARLIHLLIFYDFPQIVFTIAYCVFGIAVIMTWWLIPPIYPWHKIHPSGRKR
ncbi:DUF2784 domain-containing protein [Treponema sp. R80B11-R83G3]